MAHGGAAKVQQEERWPPLRQCQEPLGPHGTSTPSRQDLQSPDWQRSSRYLCSSLNERFQFHPGCR